jgi:hypothetical protein
MILFYGREAVQDAPGHGGIVLLLTLPTAGLVALCGLIPLGILFYQRFSK